MGVRPVHLTTEVAEGFQDEQVVAVYHQRPPYPAEAFTLLLELAAGGPVLDLGCGPGDIARRIAPHVERVDAVDFSDARRRWRPAQAGSGSHGQLGHAVRNAVAATVAWIRPQARTWPPLAQVHRGIYGAQDLVSCKRP